MQLRMQQPSSRRSLLMAARDALEVEQERWFLWLPVAFGVGIAIYFGLHDEPPLWPLLPAVLAAALLYGTLRDRGLLIVAGGAVFATVAGFAMVKLRTEAVRAPVLERAVGPVAVDGWVELVEARPKRGERLTIRVHAISGVPPEGWPARIRVRTLAVDDRLSPGDAIRVRAMLSPPGEPALPGDYDFGRAAWFLGLGAVGYARDPPERVTLAEPPWSLRWRAPIERLRRAIGQRIAAALPGETGAIAVALITGERGGISDATNDAFRDSGLLHILSISGLHMVIMAGAVFMLVRFLLTLSPAIALRYPTKKWAATAAALAAFGYLLISGASFPTVRSYLTISIMYLAVLLDRPAVALRNVALSALLILAIWPESLIDVSFQMSFAAVAGLVAVYEVLRAREEARVERRGPPGLMRQVLRLAGGILLSTLIASFAVAPFAAYHFHKSQQFAMLANLLAIPVCNLLVMPMALLTLVAMPLGLEAAPLWAMGKGIEAMVWCAYAVAGLPGAVTRIPAIPSLAFGLMVAGGLWLALWQSRCRWLGVLPVLLGLAIAPMRSVPHVLVSRDGSVVGFRGADGRIVATGTRAGAFDLARWLEHDGDDRQAETLLRERPRGLDCDWQGCTIVIRGRRIALGRHPSALVDDCRASDVVIALFAVSEDRGCVADAAADPLTSNRAKPLLISRQALVSGGAHLIVLDGDGGPPRHINVADWRGRRPWSDAVRPRGARSLRQRLETSPGTAPPAGPDTPQGHREASPDPPAPPTPPESRDPTAPGHRDDE